MNMDIFNKNNNISSIDTFQMDPYRKKQLEVIEKSLNPSRYNTLDYAENSRLTYFANKGINIIKWYSLISTIIPNYNFINFDEPNWSSRYFFLHEAKLQREPSSSIDAQYV